MMLRYSIRIFIIGLIFCTSPAFAQGTTAFTYQGQLHDGGTNANGTYSMTFKLYDAASGGGQIGVTISNSPTLANGLFSVNLDFGAAAFDGDARWLEITTQTGNNAPEILSPRVPLLPAPYAIYAAVAATVTNGSVTDAKIVTVSGDKVIGSVASAASAASLVGGTWNVSVGNYQTYTNILRFTAAGSQVMAAHGGGVVVNGELEANVLTVNGSSIQFPAQSGAAMTVNSSGDFVFDNNLSITALGGIRLPAPGGSRSISANNQGITVDGISVSAANGIIFPTSGGGSVNITASGQNIYIPQGGLTLGTGGIDAQYASFSGGIFAGYGSFGSSITAASGSFNGPVSAGNVNFNNGTFNGSISATNGTFSGPVEASYFNTTSDRNAKEQFTAINAREILDRVASLPISSWNFKADGSTRHIGPMAQDFYAAFNVGLDDKHIATMDADGVALAAIQGLNEKLKEKDAKLEAMEKRLAELEQWVKTSALK